MAGLLDYLPLQVRTLVETASGNRSPITERNLSEEDKMRIAEAIAASRAYKQGLLDMNKTDPNMSDANKRAYNQFFPNQQAIKDFQSGSGAVGYDAYADAGQGTSDWNFLPSGSIRNTLGQFRYNTDKNGNINIKEKYDFANDTVDGLPRSVSNSARYETMSAPQKAWTVAKETFVLPEVGFNPAMGISSLPSRYGNAFVGRDGRDVNINFKPKINVNPNEDLRYRMLLDLSK